ncbi:MAG: hypothetical protein M0C28_22210 [Candidatus Moduliflexus flocculans]|nr:hypothetical protein [Candidatus Moduliflexus flocculans]
MKKKLQENSVPSTGEVEKIRSLIEQAIQKTRRLSRGLCPVFLADHGLESLLAGNGIKHTRCTMGLPAGSIISDPS